MEKFVYAICTSDGHFIGLMILSDDDIIEDNGISTEDGVFELTYRQKNAPICVYYISKICVD